MVEGIKSTKLQVFLVVLIAVFANALWLGEIVWIKGWAGTNWLKGSMGSALLICLLVPVAVLLMVDRFQRLPPTKISGFVLISAIVLMICYEITRASLFRIHALGFLDHLMQGHLRQNLSDFAVLAGIPFAIALAGLILPVILNLMIQPMKRTAFFYFVGAFLLTVPASLVSIHIFPALDGSTDYIHAVKMGYPAFWTVLLTAVAAGLSRQKEP
jgi:hypothetical protein